jgi:acrylyl-CoA reductase (NADPH)
LCVTALQHQGATPADGEVLVTGATGGVGSIAVALLAGLGFKVVAMTGKPDQAGFLKELGASRLVGRDELAQPSKPGRFVLEAETFAAAVDTVGGPTLASIIARLKYGGSVAACGLVGGVELDTHVFPFILRGVSLLGIDSVRCPTPRRLDAWRTLATTMPPAALEGLTREISLEQVVEEAGKILAGQARGRVLVNLA